MCVHSNLDIHPLSAVCITLLSQHWVSRYGIAVPEFKQDEKDLQRTVFAMTSAGLASYVAAASRFAGANFTGITCGPEMKFDGSHLGASAS